MSHQAFSPPTGMFNDRLDADRVVPLLRGRFGSRYVYAMSCESTQRLLTDSLPEGAVAVAEHQTAGRGRLGRRWEAPACTAILCSLLLRPPLGHPAPQLSLVCGLAVARVVEETIGRPSQIKWPNDVLADGCKVAGVLAEVRGGAVVLGIGMNVNQSTPQLPGDVAMPAASLFTIDGVRRDRAVILAQVLFELERSHDAWLASGLESLLPELERRDVLRGRRITVGGTTGIADGIAPDGRLALDASGQRLLVSSGHIVDAPPLNSL